MYQLLFVKIVCTPLSSKLSKVAYLHRYLYKYSRLKEQQILTTELTCIQIRY
jgi:hypothetical protein